MSKREVFILLYQLELQRLGEHHLVSRILKAPRSSIYRWRVGDSNPPYSAILRLCRARNLLLILEPGGSHRIVAQQSFDEYWDHHPSLEGNFTLRLPSSMNRPFDRYK